ncbi:MAG: YkgJ family cysteine cluster protein [Candidatus Thorarchaeota archaeon]
MKSLQLGGICSNFHCAKCCRETEMLLSMEDITRIVSLGYKQGDFSFINNEGFFCLRNINDSCFFLQDNKCVIYSFRPQGCKYYPIIFDLDTNKAIIDVDCPLKSTIQKSTVKLFEKEIRKYVNRLIEEKDK